MSFDSANALLLDLNEFLNAAANHSNAEKQSATANNAQWMENYGGSTFDLFAPDPDLFDSELEASADLSQLDIPFPAHDTVQPLPPSAYYGSYRSGPASAFNGTVSSVSESQSGYNDYDTASFYSGHESGYNHHITANGSLYSAHGGGGSAVGIAVPQQSHFHSTLSSQPSANSHFGAAGSVGAGTNTTASDLDLDFSEFNLSVNSGLHAALGAVPPPPLQGHTASAPTPGLGISHPHHHRSHSHSTGAAPAVGASTTVPTPAIDTSALNSVHLFMNPASVIPSFTTSQSSSQSPTDHPSTITNNPNSAPSSTSLHHPQPEMYFPRRGDPHAPGMASSSSQQQQQQGGITQQQQQIISQGSGQQRPAKREATSSPAIPAPEFGSLDQFRPGKRLAASSSQEPDEASGNSGSNAKRYKCPSCERGKSPLPTSLLTIPTIVTDSPAFYHRLAFARAYNLKTHMATHDPHRVKAFICRHTGCGRSFSRKHDLGRHYTSIHGGSTGPSGNNSGNLSGEERAALRGHRAGSSSAYGRSSASANIAGSSRTRAGTTEDDDEDGSNSGGSSSTEGEAVPQPPVSPQLIQPSGSGSSVSQNQQQQQIQHRERVWCDGCGRGWIKGTREACECDPSIRGTQFRNE